MAREEQNPDSSFYYPDNAGGNRMCADGQRRAADYSLRVHGEYDSGEQTEGVTEVLDRAARAEVRFQKGMGQDKRDLIAFQVIMALLRGHLYRFVNKKGDFLLEAYDGTKIPRNVHDERARGKNFH